MSEINGSKIFGIRIFDFGVLIKFISSEIGNYKILIFGYLNFNLEVIFFINVSNIYKIK